MTEEGMVKEGEMGEATDMNEYTQLYGEKPEKRLVLISENTNAIAQQIQLWSNFVLRKNFYWGKARHEQETNKIRVDYLIYNVMHKTENIMIIGSIFSLFFFLWTIHQVEDENA